MINVIGLGYIGLPTALMLASHGVEVVGTDYNKELVETLRAGHTTFKAVSYTHLYWYIDCLNAVFGVLMLGIVGMTLWKE